MRAGILALLLLSLVAGSAVAGPPRGRRVAAPRATHVVVTETALKAGGVSITLRPGAEVAVPSLRALAPIAGSTKATSVGAVMVSGQVDGRALGMRVGADADLRSPDGRRIVGRAKAGTLVRIVGGRAPAGHVLVETVGFVRARAAIQAGVLTAARRELVFDSSWDAKLARAADLAAADADGPSNGAVEAGAPVSIVKLAGDRALVRTFGGAQIEGWVAAASLAKRAATDMLRAEADLVRPTHEVFADAPIYADPRGKRLLGTVRGGTLVEVSKGAVGPLAKVLTRGNVVASAYVKRSDLRELEASVWAEGAR